MGRHDALLVVAAKAAHRYAAQVWWMDVEDLRQEAIAVALHAARPGGPYDPQCGVPLDAYVWRACVLALRSYCWRMSAPVSATSHDLAALRGVHHEAIMETSATTEIDAFALLSEKRWMEEVRDQLDYLFSQDGRGRIVHRVLIDGEPPALVARTARCDAQDVYRAVRRARVTCANNAWLHRLWREAPP